MKYVSRDKFLIDLWDEIKEELEESLPEQGTEYIMLAKSQLKIGSYLSNRIREEEKWKKCLLSVSH